MASVNPTALTAGPSANEVPAQPTPLPASPAAGVCMHITSLPGPHGIGELGDESLAFVDLLVEMGISVWQLLPTGPTAYGDSPYQPLSSFAGNEMFIDVGELVQLGLLESKELAALRDLPMDSVDYGALIPEKWRLLHRAASRFESHASVELRSECDRFVQKHSQLWLHDYAIFRILKWRHDQRAWPEWDPEFVRRDPAALRLVENSEADRIAEIKILQFLFDRQWQRLHRYARSRGVQLFGDIPIYIALDSADAWAQPELLRIDAEGNMNGVAGVPPDYFSEDGQRWGNPLYAWGFHRKTGYAWWIERMRHTIRMVDLVRIDHFRGFEAYWAIPAHSETARDGAWELGPCDAIFDAMREALGNLPIIAEDLGEITPEVDALRARQGIPGMVVLQFEIGDEAFDPDTIQARSVCYTGTHDNDTVVGWFHGGPGDIRTRAEVQEMQQTALALLDGKAESIHHDVLRFALATRSRLVIAPLQDLLGLGSESRMNIPGTSSNNWRWRVRSDQLRAPFRQKIRSMMKDSGRSRAADPAT